MDLLIRDARNVGQSFRFLNLLAYGIKSEAHRAPARPYPDDLISRALLANELQSIFANAPQAPNALAHENVREAYARTIGKAPELTPMGSKRRIPGPEDSCPICYECMHGVSQDKLVFCEECGNALHTECFGRCSLSAVPFLLSVLTELAGRQCAAQLTCVWCRAKWPSGAKSGAGASSTSEGYINLGNVAGCGERDTSTCALRYLFGLPCPLMTPLPLDHQSWRYGNRAGRA